MTLSREQILTEKILQGTLVWLKRNTKDRHLIAKFEKHVKNKTKETAEDVSGELFQ